MDVTKKLSSLQEISKSQLSKILSANPNKKYLILETQLIRPLEKVCGVKWLKGNGVEKIFKLEATATDFSSSAIFYMIYSSTRTFNQVLNQIRSQVNIENPVKNKIHIICVPKILHSFEEELESLGLLYSAVTIHSFQWMPLNLDTNILSLEIPKIYSQLFVYQDTAFLPTLSKTLWQLGFVTGKPSFIISLGAFSNAILKQYEMFCDERGDSDKLDSDFGALLILDRNIDYPSVLLTPGTYAALLNEVYDVQVGICENKEETSEIVDNKNNPIIPKQMVNINLDSKQDNVYADIKNQYFTEVTAVLSNLTKQLRSEKVSSKDMALDEIKHYVQTKLQATKLKKKLVTNHLNAAESIINILGHRYENQREVESNIIKNCNKSNNIRYLEEILVTENDKYSTLRLFCLICITQCLSDNEIKTFWKKYLHQFGFKYGFAFHNLINTGFIPDFSPTVGKLTSKLMKIPKFTSSNFYSVSKNFKQIISEPDKVNLKYPTCASYVFGGLFIPLITKIASLILSSPTIDEIKLKLETLGPLTIKNNRGFPLQSRNILIFVVGGVTYAEVAACDILSTITGSKIFLLSDKIISGNDLIQGILNFPE